MPGSDTPDPLPDAGDELEPVERWFVQRGVPVFVERRTDGSILDTWTRALPLLVATYLLGGLNALDLRNWSVGENLLVALFVVAVLLTTWALSNRLRGMPTFSRPTDIDAPELVLYILGPAVPVLIVGQPRDALESAVGGIVFLVLVYLWYAFGVGPIVRWVSRRSLRQLSGLGPLIARALPLLLLFNTFLFINAEVWELAGTLEGAAYVAVLAIFLGLGTLFALSQIPSATRGLNTFESWDQIAFDVRATPATAIDLPSGPFPGDPLRPRQRFNIGLVILIGQAVQVILVVAVLTAFFVGFGLLAVSEATAQGWTRLDDVHVLARLSLDGRDLVVSEPLVRVAVFLGTFSGMYFTVVLITDDTYRREFADDVGPEIREALAVRAAYRVARGTSPAVTGVTTR